MPAIKRARNAMRLGWMAPRSVPSPCRDRPQDDAVRTCPLDHCRSSPSHFHGVNPAPDVNRGCKQAFLIHCAEERRAAVPGPCWGGSITHGTMRRVATELRMHGARA